MMNKLVCISFKFSIQLKKKIWFLKYPLKSIEIKYVDFKTT